MNQWPGVRVRVTEAWDEESHHARNSLHYEGRAVDLTTSDRDRSKYGLLASLAVEAGFDWVYYESRSHVHASCKAGQSFFVSLPSIVLCRPGPEYYTPAVACIIFTLTGCLACWVDRGTITIANANKLSNRPLTESAHPGQQSGCFPASAKVVTSNGLKRMDEVVPGDKVKAVTSDGSLVFSEVLMFLDRSPKEVRRYVTLKTEKGRSLKLTPTHLVYAGDRWCDELSCMRATFAGLVKEGQAVMVEEEEVLVARLVDEVSSTTELGVFAPLTREGNLVVEGVLASSYAVIDSQRIAHASFAPVRWVSSFSDSVRALWRTISLGRSLPRSSGALSPLPEGVHWYPRILYTVAGFLLPSHLLP